MVDSAKLKNVTFEVDGKPLPEGATELFGHFGDVTGVLVMTLNIDVFYADGSVVTFMPVMHPEKQRKQ